MILRIQIQIELVERVCRHVRGGPYIAAGNEYDFLTARRKRWLRKSRTAARLSRGGTGHKKRERRGTREHTVYCVLPVQTIDYRYVRSDRSSRCGIALKACRVRRSGDERN